MVLLKSHKKSNPWDANTSYALKLVKPLMIEHFITGTLQTPALVTYAQLLLPVSHMYSRRHGCHKFFAYGFQ